MRYYCDSSHSLDHTSGSLNIFKKFLAPDYNNADPRKKNRILDLGCGNGRNSLYLAKQYPNSSVILVDKDESMLNWAKKQFSLAGITDVEAIYLPIEQLAANPSRCLIDNNAAAATTTTDPGVGTNIQCFDIVIFSYVVQHIDPSYYPLVFDYCQKVCRGCLLLDVFWNPSRVGEGERISYGNDVDWYGISYEELATWIAPRFSLFYDRIVHNEIAVVVNMALTPGTTPLESMLSRQYEYYSDKLGKRHASTRVNGTEGVMRPVPPSFDLEGIPCVKLMYSLYPDKLDFIKSEILQWIQESGRRRLPLALLAAKFLWLCRSNKVPVMLNEVHEDFDVSRKALVLALSSDSYIPALGPYDYVERICRQMQLAHDLEDEARLLLDNDGLVGGNPVIRACCAIIRAMRRRGLALRAEQIAKIARVTSVAIRNSLKRAETRRIASSAA